jgi:choline dehydrogenase-like flavoprotein
MTLDQLAFAFIKEASTSRLRRVHVNYGKKNLVAAPGGGLVEEFDYIIIGGGSAGCVLASRLSEMPSKKVLLVEAGDEDNHLFIKIPAAMVKLFGSSYVYNYQSVSQANKGGGTVYIPQGRGLGGSSSVNAMA